MSRTQVLGASSYMVRSGLYLSDQREPLLYYEFVYEVSGYVDLEADRIGARIGKRSWHVPQDNAFMTAANMILDKDIIVEPRAVAWGLILDGLKFCERYAKADYAEFLGGVLWLVKMEREYAKHYPKLNKSAF